MTARGFFGYSREEQEGLQEELLDREENWRNEECFMCGLARKIVVHSDAALDEYHPFVGSPEARKKHGTNSDHR